MTREDKWINLLSKFLRFVLRFVNWETGRTFLPPSCSFYLYLLSSFGKIYFKGTMKKKRHSEVAILTNYRINLTTLTGKLLEIS